MPTPFKADTIRINNIESTGSVGPAGNRFAVVKVSASLHLLNTSSIRFNDSTEISSSKAGVLNFYANDTYFSSSVKIINLTGALHVMPSGLTYLQAGSGITITSGANSQVTIAAPSTTTFDNQVPYVTLNATSSLASERVLTASDGIVLVDGGAGAAVTLSANGTVARTSGSRFDGSVTVTGTGSFETGLSGSLTKLTDGTSYLIAGSGITVTSASAGITIASTVTGGGSLDQSYDTPSGGRGAQIFVDGQPMQLSVTGATSTIALAVTGVAVFGTGSSLPAFLGSDVTFYVSGVVASQGTSIPGTAFFAGDLATSGTFTNASRSFSHYRMSAADFTAGNASQGSFTTNTGSVSASFWQNNAGQTMQLKAPLHIPHNSTIREIMVHLSKSNTSDAILTLLKQDTTSSLQTQVVNTVNVQQGEFIDIKFTDLSESTNAPGVNVQNAYYIVVAFGNAGASTHKMFGGHCKYEYQSIFI